MATTEDFKDGGEGLKRICQSCGMKYYDLNKAPIVCPNCGSEFDPEAVLSSRRTRVVEEPELKGEEDEDGEESEAEEEKGIDEEAKGIEAGAIPAKASDGDDDVEDDDDEEDKTYSDSGSDDTLLVEDDDDNGLGDLITSGDDNKDDG